MLFNIGIMKSLIRADNCLQCRGGQLSILRGRSLHQD
jgi:hypothetical protein